MRMYEDVEALAKVSPILFLVQQDLKNLKAETDNPHLETKYVPLPQWINAIRSACKKHGMTISQSSDFAFRGEMPGVEVYTYLDAAGGSLAYGPLFVPISEKNDRLNRPQKTAAAATYARRYQLMEIFFVSSDIDDTDAADSQPPEAEPQREPEWQAYLRHLNSRNHTELARMILEAYEVPFKDAALKQLPNWNPDSSLGGIVSLVKAVSRAIGVGPEQIIKDVMKEA